MKKALSLLLALTLCIGLCACKSDEVKNVETQIGTLTANSNYTEIHSVYSLYSSLSSKDQDKVDNLDVLAEYCNPLDGRFVLTDEMLQEIEKEIYSTSEFSGTNRDLLIKSVVNDWHVSNIKTASHKQTDAYTYNAYGTFIITDKYGETSEKKFTTSYIAEYSTEETSKYKISHDTRVQ